MVYYYCYSNKRRCNSPVCHFIYRINLVMENIITHSQSKKNDKLYNIMLKSIYPFQFTTNLGQDLQESYKLIYNSTLLIKNNKDIFQSILKWNNDEYIKYLKNNLLLCDLIYMLTHVYLRYPYETKLFHNILIEIENLYFTLFNEEELIIKNDLLLQYYNQIKEIDKIYNRLKHVYNTEMDKLLVWDDKFTKKYDKDRNEFLSLYLEKKNYE